MTNVEIITNECRRRGITEQVETLPYWRKAGYTIAAGTRPLFTVQIWKPVREAGTRKLKMVNTGFFGKSQVMH